MFSRARKPTLLDIAAITHAEAFVTELLARDFDRLVLALAPDVIARFLLPRGTDELVGARAVARRLEGWFANADDFTVLAVEAERVGNRLRLRCSG